MAMKRKEKKVLTQAEIEARRAEWAKLNPEKAKARKAKSKPAADAKDLNPETANANKVVTITAKEQREENDVLIVSKTDLRYRSKYIRDFKNAICDRCEAYVLDRDAEKVALTRTEKKFAKMVVERYYYHPEQEYQPLACGILREMLRWPDPELNVWAYNFLEEQHAKGHIVIMFWFILWCERFVPADAVRLLLDEGEDGNYHPKPEFRQIVNWISSWVFKALDYEYERLETVKTIEDKKIRDKEVKRKNKRIQYFLALISTYELTRKD